MADNRAAILANILTNLPDNTTGVITPALLRTTFNDLVNNMKTLLDADTLAAVNTFTVAPIFTALTGVLVGNGASALTALSNAALQAQLNQGYFTFKATAVNFNALADTTVPITLPTGYTRYKVTDVTVSNASLSLTTAKFGIYTAASQGGVNIVAQVLTGITSTVTDVSPNAFTATIVNLGTITFNDANLFINIGTAQGAAATADVSIVIRAVP